MIYKVKVLVLYMIAAMFIIFSGCTQKSNPGSTSDISSSDIEGI